MSRPSHKVRNARATGRDEVDWIHPPLWLSRFDFDVFPCDVVEGAEEAELLAAGAVEGRRGCGLQSFNDRAEPTEVVRRRRLDYVAEENNEW